MQVAHDSVRDGSREPAVSVTFGRYRLLDRIGRGGMAEVFKAKSYGVEGFEKVVVIKRILPDLAKSKEFVEMFIEEAKLAVRLSHANIVQVFDLGLAPGKAGDEADAYYMAMEFVHGFDLASILARCRRATIALPIEMCVYVASEVAKGLDHAHRRRDEQMKPLGIVHRDVSPQNVLLSLEGEVKVTDFGIAKAKGALESGFSEDTIVRKLQGKFGYMSPEQAKGENVDARSDLFSLGTVLYECLTGVNPFTAPTVFETLRRVQACEFPPVELLRPDCPPELVAIVKTAMAKLPEDRYADAGRMYEALIAFLYTQGRRYGSHQLAEFLGKFRATDESVPPHARLAEGILEEGGATAHERTPVEVPSMRIQAASVRMEASPATVDLTAAMPERREVTALVLEFPERDSPLSEKATAIIARYGGRLFKEEPEHITALFGLYEPDGRDTEMATRSALVMLRALDAPRRPSAGLHTARIHVTSDGDPEEDERLTGLMATARSLARVREGFCAVSAPAMRQLRHAFAIEPLTDRENVGHITGAAVVLDVKSPAETFGRFVGRKDELRVIGETLALATRRQARVLTVRGEHGTGKTRLFYEVERRLRKGGYNVGWHFATCPPRGRELPLSGIACMLQELCGVIDGDSPERIADVSPRLRALGLQDEDVLAVLNLLGASTPAPIGNMKAMLRNAFSRMIASLSSDRPHVFAWDAAHWMDAASFGMLEVILSRLVNARAVFIFGARAGFSHPLEKLPSHASIHLSDLPADDVARLIALRLGVDRAPHELVTFVMDRAGGHPLFVEEVLKGLVDARAVTVAEKHIVSMRLVGQDLALPKTLRGLVASRVARLAPEDRSILQAAAVLGDPFDGAMLAKMTAKPLPALERALATLRERDFLIQRSASELRFASPVVRDVVADAIVQDMTREMHAAAGAALEASLGENAWEQAHRIATHWYEAGDRERAAEYFAKSAERRLESQQLEAAARDFARAFELTDVSTRAPEQVLAWLAGLASAVRLVRTLPEAAETCTNAVARIDKEGSTAHRVQARVHAARILGALHQFEAAHQYLEDAVTIAGDDAKLTRTARAAAAELAGRQGDFKRSIAELKKMEPSGGSLGDAREEHKFLMSLAQAHAALGEERQSTEVLARAEALLPDDATARCERDKLKSLVHYFARDYGAAAAVSEQAIEQSRALGLSYEVALNTHNLGDILVKRGDLGRAYGAFQQSLTLCEEAGYERLASHNRMFLSYLDGVAGDPEADKRILAGVRYAEANEFTWDVLTGRALLAELWRKRGARDAAHAEYEKVLAMARDTGNVLVAQDCEAALSELHAEAGAPSSA